MHRSRGAYERKAAYCMGTRQELRSVFAAVVNAQASAAGQKALVEILVIDAHCLDEHRAHADHPLPEPRPVQKKKNRNSITPISKSFRKRKRIGDSIFFPRYTIIVVIGDDNVNV